MTYEEARQWLYGLAPRGIRLELDRMKRALELLGHPERDLRVVHLAGTNGKGSVAAMIERALREAGLRTGLYTSPHLHTFRERIRIDGQPIAQDEVAQRASRIRGLLEHEDAPELTFFEVTTLIALGAFHDAECDVVVLEVGLGGRFDATNVIDQPLATVITSIGMDHQKYLGSTLEEIALEKAGIIKDRVPLIVGALPEAALEVIVREAALKNAPVLHTGPGRVSTRTPSSPPPARPSYPFDVAAERPRSERPSSMPPKKARLSSYPFEASSSDEAPVPEPLPVSSPDAYPVALAGVHQQANAAVAVATLRMLRPTLAIEDDAIRRGLAKVEWPGRLESIGRVLLDAAHNPDGAIALAAYLAKLPRSGPRILLFGVMADKDWTSMLDVLMPEVDRVIAVAPKMARAEDPKRIAQAIGGEAAVSVADGLERAARVAADDGMVIVAGSIFVLAEARAALLECDSEAPIGL